MKADKYIISSIFSSSPKCVYVYTYTQNTSLSSISFIWKKCFVLGFQNSISFFILWLNPIKYFAWAILILEIWILSLIASIFARTQKLPCHIKIIIFSLFSIWFFSMTVLFWHKRKGIYCDCARIEYKREHMFFLIYHSVENKNYNIGIYTKIYLASLSFIC